MTTSGQSFCRLCLAGCGIVVHSRDGRPVSIRGAADHPTSLGYTCSKGRSLAADHNRSDRLDRFYVGRGPARRAVDAAAALSSAAEALGAAVETHGPDAVATYRGNSAGFDRAGAFAAARFVRALGTTSVYSATTLDNVPKVAVSSLMTRHRSDGLVPVLDTEVAHLTILVGANPVLSHGHDWAMPDPVRRLRAASTSGQLWVIDPRRTETARLADVHLPVRPGGDLAVVAYLVNELLRDGADDAYLDRYSIRRRELHDAVRPYDLERAASVSDLAPSDLESLLDEVRRSPTIAVRSGTGVTMSSNPTVTEWLIWALQIVTGSFEEPGGCWFQPGFFSHGVTERAPAAGSAPTSSPDTGLPRWRGERPSVELADAIEDGRVRALVCLAGNPLTAFPDAGRLRRLVQELDVVIVADVRATTMTELATHVWACRSQLERADLNVGSKYAPVVHGEYTAAVVEPTPGTEPLWKCLARVGALLDRDVLPECVPLDGATDDDVLRLAATDAPVPFDELRHRPGVVVAAATERGWVRRHVLPDGRWDLAPQELCDELDRVARDDPESGTGLQLVVRRPGDHINSKLVGLDTAGRTETPVLAMHHSDASAVGVQHGSFAAVSANGHTVVTRVAIDDTLRRGVVTHPYGFDGANINELHVADQAVDRLSGMPRLSRLAVTVEPHRPEPTPPELTPPEQGGDPCVDS